MISFGLAISLLVAFLVLLTIYLGVKIVPQSKVYVIERFGRYHRTLNAGLSIIIPYLDTVAHRIDILERQLESQQISVITKDNVEVELETSVFYRVIDASRSVYRISNLIFSRFPSFYKEKEKERIKFNNLAFNCHFIFYSRRRGNKLG